MSPPSSSTGIPLPPEVLLQIFENIPYDCALAADLSLVHPCYQSLLKTHERSLVKAFVRKNALHAFRDFPCNENDASFAWLSKCIHQYNIADEVMAILLSDGNCRKVEYYNRVLVFAGIFLMYQLCAIESHEGRLDFIKSLPNDPLTAIWTAVHASQSTARFYGMGYTNWREYGQYMDAELFNLRCDIEWCFAEAALNIGPSFIFEIMDGDGNLGKDAETGLLCVYHDVVRSEENPRQTKHAPVTQGPFRKPGSLGAPLYSTMIERLAELRDCPHEEIVNLLHSEVHTPQHPLSCLCMEEKERLIRGHNLERHQDPRVSGNV